MSLIVKNLNCDLQNKQILKNISFELPESKVCAILGESGSGKTTLLRCIAGLEVCTSEEIQFCSTIFQNQNLFLLPYQRNIGFVFQDHALFPNMSVFENIAYGLQNHINQALQIEKVLKLVGLQDFKNKKPYQLSGGEKQRVALARSLAPEPKLLLLDEPFSSLDEKLKNNVREEFFKIIKNLKITTLLVTHDLSEAQKFADYVGLIDKNNFKGLFEKEKVFKLEPVLTPQLVL